MHLAFYFSHCPQYFRLFACLISAIVLSDILADAWLQCRDVLARVTLHAPISSSYNTGYQIYKKQISFTLVVDAFHVCVDDSVNDIFLTEISEICVKKNIL